MTDFEALGVYAIIILLLSAGGALAQWVGIYLAVERRPASYTAFSIAGILHLIGAALVWISVTMALSKLGVFLLPLHLAMFLLLLKAGWLLWASIDAKKIVAVADEQTRKKRVYIGYAVIAVAMCGEMLAEASNLSNGGFFEPIATVLAEGFILVAIAGILYQMKTAWTYALPLLAAGIVLKLIPWEGINQQWIRSVVFWVVVGISVLRAINSRKQQDAALAHGVTPYAQSIGTPAAMPDAMPQAQSADSYTAQQYEATPHQQTYPQGYSQVPQQYAEGSPQIPGQYGQTHEYPMQNPQDYPGQYNPQTSNPQQ